MLDALSVATLAPWSALVTLHTVLGLIDGEDWLTPILIVACCALLIAFQGSVDLCRCGVRAEECRYAGTHQKKPNQFAHLFPSHRESGSVLRALRPEPSERRFALQQSSP